MHESLQGIPLKIAQDSVNKAKDRISEGEHAGAIDALMEGAFFLPRFKDKSVLDLIGSIESGDLDKELREKHLMLGVSYASLIGAHEVTVEYIEKLEDEFKDRLEEKVLDGFALERARLALDKGQRSLAVIAYKNLSDKETTSSREVAIAYQGLALLSSNDDDKAYYSRLSADKFLEAGLKKDAIGNLLKLSTLQSKELPSIALKTLERCLALVDSEDLLDKHGKAHLLQTKAEYLHKLDRLEEALTSVEEACELESGVFGAEISLHTSLRLAAIYSDGLEREERSLYFTDSAIEVASTVKDPSFLLQQKVASRLSEHQQLSDELLKEVLDSEDSSLIGAVLLKESTNPSISITESMAFLEDALKHLEKKDTKGVIDLVYFHFGLIYQRQELKSDAEDSYLKSLNFNPYNHSSANNLVAIYMEDESWEKGEQFILKRMKLLGELPNHCFLYAKTLYKQHKYREALEYFRKATPDTNEVQDLIEDCITNLAKPTVITDFKPELIVRITSEDILSALKEFSETVSANSRMHFWYFHKEQKKYKWSSKPEETSKQLLIQFLSAKFGRENVTIIQEPRAGAGFIDLFLLFSGGLKVVVELKMCGAGYTSTYALSGEDQIVHYQDNTGSNLGYLVVFDSRKRDFAKGLKELQIVGNKTIYSIAVDVRTNVK
ncbi:tetratricopeptide repeat protein [Vibrio lentus]|uniref:tetratricopeptide repeat protein n=1 Tax=Vibrio lentus TaxID=136468 RepID=UPI0010BDF6E8|nr:hypothetical protein [Vibrio lentus]TKG17734.1 hypothetical protein FCW05_12570 [Vibrio lentus]